MIFLIFAAAFRKLYHRFPEPGWRMPMRMLRSAGTFELKLSHVYGIVAAAGLATRAISEFFYRESEIIRIFMAAAGGSGVLAGDFLRDPDDHLQKGEGHYFGRAAVPGRNGKFYECDPFPASRL